MLKLLNVFTQVSFHSMWLGIQLLQKCVMIARNGVGYKPPSYHDTREKLLKQAVLKTDVLIQEYKDEWKRTGCTIMSNGQIRKDDQFVNFW